MKALDLVARAERAQRSRGFKIAASVVIAALALALYIALIVVANEQGTTESVMRRAAERATATKSGLVIEEGPLTAARRIIDAALLTIRPPRAIEGPPTPEPGADGTPAAGDKTLDVTAPDQASSSAPAATPRPPAFEAPTSNGPLVVGLVIVAVTGGVLAVTWLGLLLTYALLLLLGWGVAWPLMLLPSTAGFGTLLLAVTPLALAFLTGMQLLRVSLSGPWPLTALARNVLQEAVRMKISLIFIVALLLMLAYVPGALNAPYGSWRGPESNPGLELTDAQLTERLQSLGIEPGERVVITGGLAGDGPHFIRTLTGLNGTIESGQICAIGLYGDRIRIGHGSAGGWDVFGPERRITRADGNRLYELDGKPALDLYKAYLGEEAERLPGSALLFPLQIFPAGAPEGALVRTVVGIEEDARAMVFAGDIPEGWGARLMRGNFDHLVQGAAEAAHQANAETVRDRAAILVSCIGRKLLMGQRIAEEVEAVQTVRPPAYFTSAQSNSGPQSGTKSRVVRPIVILSWGFSSPLARRAESFRWTRFGRSRLGTSWY